MKSKTEWRAGPVKRKPLTDEEMDAIAEAFTDGASMRMLETRHKCSGDAIRNALAKRGINWRMNPKPELPPIPEDTRTYTQRFFGDPLPGRSALDRMRKQAQAAGVVP